MTSDSVKPRRRKLLRTRWLPLVVLVTISAVISLALFRSRSADAASELLDLSALDDHITKQQVFYWDRSDIYNKMSPAQKISNTELKIPLLVRQMRIQHLSGERIKEIVLHAAAEEPGWKFADFPGTIGNTQVPAGFSGQIGPNHDPSRHSISVVTNFDWYFLAEQNKVSLDDGDYVVLEMRPLRWWEIWTLRLKSLGKNPFSKDGPVGNNYK